MKTFTQFRPAVMLVIATLICLSARATDQIVNSNADSGPGTLRQAIANVSDGGNITFNLSATFETITVASDIVIQSKSLTIDGTNSAGSGVAVTVKVTSPGTSPYRVFTIYSAVGKTINIQNMTVKGGNINGGGGSLSISSGTLNLTNMTLSDSKAVWGGAMALNTYETVTISSSTIINNETTSPNPAGGIYFVNGSLIINNSTITNNRVGEGSGGGIGMEGGTLTVNNSIITNNVVTLGGGGGISVLAGSATVNNSTITANSASADGGAIYNETHAQLTINSSTINGNTCAGSGAGIVNFGSCTVVSSTFNGNSSAEGRNGGGIYNSGTLSLISSTISGNTAQSEGGGIYNAEGNSFLLNSIIINNTGNADLYNRDGSVYAYYSWYNMTSGSISVQATAPNVTTAYNSSTGLEALAMNLPGTTKTMATKPGCPAIGTGTLAYYNSSDGYYFVGSNATSHKLTDWGTSPTVSASDKVSADQRGAPIFAPATIGAYYDMFPVHVIATSGTTSGDYLTLKAAFDAINAGTHQGDITVLVNESTTETASAVLNASSSPSSYTSVNIHPTSAGLSISGSLATPLIDLNGADHVTIDGRVNATGSTPDLVISNTSTASTAGTSTIRFINDAVSNTVQYCNLKGSTLDANGGVLLFSTTTGSTGNDNNKIDHCNLTCSADANRPANLVYALGTSGKENSGNSISNNNFYNFMRADGNSYGIFLFTFNTAWTIVGNSFYETSTFVPSGSLFAYYMIYIDSFGYDYSVTGNYIGGTAPLCGGAAFTKSSSPQYNNNFDGIFLITYTGGTANNIQGNTISNMNWTNSGAAAWRGIHIIGSGDINIGTTGANTIGASTGNSSISFTGGATGASCYGMYISNTGTMVVQNNIIGSVTASNVAANATNIYGIYATGTGNTTISNNTVGSTITANSINATSASSTAGNPQLVYGIYSAVIGNVSISNNTVSKLTNGTTNTDISTAGLVNGITTTGGINTISNNTVRDLTIANANYMNDYRATVTGICQTSASGGQTVSGNIIYNLTNTYATPYGLVGGLYYSGGSTGTNVISGNFIHSLSFTNPNTNAMVYGLQCTQCSATFSNNIISLGDNLSTDITIDGIHESCDATYNTNFYFNTVYLYGNAGTGSDYTTAFYSNRATNIKKIRNNIFVNSRTGTTANRHSAIRLWGTTGLTIDYNDYYAPNTGGVLGIMGSSPGTAYSTLSDWQAITSQDSQSKSLNPSFASAGGTNAADYTPSNNSLVAATGTGVTTDYAGTTRNATLPSMGAYEYPVTLPVTVNATVGTLTANYNTLKAAFDAINNGTHQGSITVKINISTTETAASVLNASSSPSSYTSVNIYPTVTGLSISGNLATPLIDLNGATNVTIDGRVNATGSSKDLIITNSNTSSTAGTSTIRFINDACSNIVKYCILKGSSAATTNSGIVYFATAGSGSGNDNNTVDQNDITCSSDANRTVNVIYAYGTSGKENSGNVISNNNIFNFMRRDAYSNGILIYQNNTAFTILGNSFYETTTFVPTASGGIYCMIWINNAGVNYIISGNYIGGTSASCGGSALTKSSSPQYDTEFNGIYLNTGTGTTSNIQGNTIAKITWNNSGNRSFTGIRADGSGGVNIGTTAANTIGASSGNGSITYNCGSDPANFYGIYLTNTGTTVVSNNILGSISGTNSYNNSTSIYGIIKTTSGTTTISNNSIGSTVTIHSIQSVSSSLEGTQNVFGISCYGNTVVSNNVIANLENSCIAQGQVVGIIASYGTFSITNNTIRDLTTTSSITFTEWYATVIGIGNWSNSSAVTISGNEIYNLSNTCSYFSGNVIGLYYNSTLALNTISGNFIHDLYVTGAESTSATIYGIQDVAGTTTYSNNIISLGGNNKTTIYGIYETGQSGSNNKLYFNTVYIGGNVASGSTNKSYALYSAVNTNSRDFGNNIFTNTRSTSGGSGLHYAIYIVSTGGSLSCDYNDYLASGTGGMLGYYGADKSALPIITGVTGNDAHSLAIDPVFASPGGTAAANYLPSATSLVAATGTGITTDYGANPRSLTYPAMGAWEYPVTPPCANPGNGGTIATDQAICYANTPAAFTSSADPSGYTGTLEYKWQLSTTSSSSGFSDIASSNAATYAPGSLLLTTWFKRLARVTCMADWTGAASSNVVQVTVYSQVVPVAGTVSNVSCFGGSNGAVSVSVSGGTLPYTYSWSGGATSSSVSNLTEGTYIVTVTDANSCTGTSSATVTEPSAALTAVASVVNNVSIYLGSDGSATVTPGGGTSPYSYSWSTTPVQTTQTASSLSAGTYWVTVSDAHSCTASSSATITQPTPPSGQVSDIIYSNIGGHQFRIDWTRGNGDGCAVFVLQGTTGLAPPVNNTSYPANTVFGTPASEIGSSGWYCVYDGTGTTVTVTGLSPATTYRVHICEYKLGSKTYNTGTSNNNPLNNTMESGLGAVASVVSNVSCSGLADGVVTVSASGGNPSYTYAWSTTPTQATQTISALAAGTYTVTVTDGVGETITSSANVTQPDVLTATAGVISNVRCFGGNDGAVSVDVSGGTGPYTYLWTGGATGSSLSNLVAGTYSVTVTDAHSCTSSSSATVTEPSAALSATAGVTHPVTCHGGADGSADVNVSGGTAGYSYAWSTIPVQTTHNATGLTPGIYYVTVTDAHSCTATSSTTLAQPPVVVPGLSGSATVCQNSTGNVYTTDAGMSNYHWVVSPGGIITAGGTSADHTVTITWNLSGAQSVAVNYSTPAGCTADDPTIKSVNVSPSPTPVISGAAMVTQGQTITYSTPLSIGHLYSWNVSNGNAQICYPDKNCITVTWSFPCGIISPGFVSVTESDPSTGCSKTVTLLITIN